MLTPKTEEKKSDPEKKSDIETKLGSRTSSELKKTVKTPKVKKLKSTPEAIEEVVEK